MKMIHATLKLMLILYICTALSGIYVLSASAKITPHDGSDDTMLITIVKGDTLWALCQKHLENPLRWRELSKYNDFTNPHLIYPGETLRIPVAMAKEIVDAVEEESRVLNEELERLRVELAESEATRDKLMAEIEGLNESMDELKVNLKALEDGLQSQEELMAAVGKSADEVSGVKEALEASKAAILDKLAKAGEHMNPLIEMLEQRKESAEAMHAIIESIQEHMATLLSAIETNQKGINELKMVMEHTRGVHEELSSSKRTLVFLTTVATGIGWFVISAIGARSGE